MADNLKFSKSSQIGEKMQGKGESDAQFKFAVACIWLTWLKEKGYVHDSLDSMPPMNFKNTAKMKCYPYKEMHLDHIVNKTHGDRYNILNAQLIDGNTHREKTDSGEYEDMRPEEYVEWINKQLNYKAVDR